MSSIAENVKRVMKEVERAAVDAGRDPSDIKILAAAKYTDRNGVEELIKAGITLIGENRVQDAKVKLSEYHSNTQADIHTAFPEVKVHLIGHLQTNKVNHALKICDLVETVDRKPLADALEKRLVDDDRILPILVEVKLTGESSKTGCRKDELPHLMKHIWTNCPHLSVQGFMGMGPWDLDPEVARPFYRELKIIFKSCRETAPDPEIFRIISMGMSRDFHVAIQEGATLVRIGRALFKET
ncbi:MAG: YggS family pyridoxal phosphate-dependent enzyme [bacterium]|nr:YggS family pyridoxal phosphate-dependent enzyme [bacterium]